MSNPTTPFSWQMPTATDLVTDLPADFEVFGQAVATSLADLLGGTTGQVLAKNSGTDMDFIWVAQDDSNAIQNAIVDAKGDLIGATAADTPARLAVGTNGQLLTADSTAATGLAWTTVSGLVLLSTTTLSGTSTSITVAANTYKNLVAYISGFSTASSGFNAGIRINSLTANYVYKNQSAVAAGTVLTTAGSTSNIEFNQSGNLSFLAANTANSFNVTFWDCNSTKQKMVTMTGGYFNNNSSQLIMTNEVNVVDATSAITNITVISNTALIGGTIEIYGVK